MPNDPVVYSQAFDAQTPPSDMHGGGGLGIKSLGIGIGGVSGRSRKHLMGVKKGGMEIGNRTLGQLWDTLGDSGITPGCLWGHIGITLGI